MATRLRCPECGAGRALDARFEVSDVVRHTRSVVNGDARGIIEELETFDCHIEQGASVTCLECGFHGGLALFSPSSDGNAGRLVAAARRAAGTVRERREELAVEAGRHGTFMPEPARALVNALIDVETAIGEAAGNLGGDDVRHRRAAARELADGLPQLAGAVEAAARAVLEAGLPEPLRESAEACAGDVASTARELALLALETAG